MDLKKVAELANKYKVEVDIKFDPVMEEMRMKVHKGNYHRARFFDYTELSKIPDNIFTREVEIAIQDVVNTDLYLKKKEEE